MEFTKGQESVFKIFDTMIDEGICVASIIPKDETLRARVRRNFVAVGGKSSTRVALESYGFIFEDYEPAIKQADAFSCFSINDDFEVVTNYEHVRHIANLYNTSEHSALKQLRECKAEMELDAISEYVRDLRVNELTYYEYPEHIRKYIRNRVGSFRRFRKIFGVDYRLVVSNHRVTVLTFTDLGRRFEKLVGSCFTACGQAAVKGVRIRDSRPDYVINDLWLDAKLSKSTVLSSNTVRKYSKHTRNLIILYAMEDIPDEDLGYIPDGVRLVHVFDYFKNLPDQLRAEIQELIDEAISFKLSLIAS